MATITVKYKCGQQVTTRHTPATEGIVTAVYIRDRGRTYEVSYCGEHGPTNCVCNEVELTADSNKPSMGFNCPPTHPE